MVVLVWTGKFEFIRLKKFNKKKKQISNFYKKF